MHRCVPQDGHRILFKEAVSDKRKKKGNTQRKSSVKTTKAQADSYGDDDADDLR